MASIHYDRFFRLKQPQISVMRFNFAGVTVEILDDRVDLIEGDVGQSSGQTCVRISSDITLVQRAVMVTASVTSMSDNAGNVESESVIIQSVLHIIRLLFLCCCNAANDCKGKY